jgi:DNA-binding transcriptional ArsR family regulator
MKSFGPVWEEALIKLWGDSKLSVSEVARRLEVDPLTVRRHAARLGLSFLRGGRRGIKPLSSDHCLKSRGIHDEDMKRRDNRRKWLAALRRTRRVSLKALRRKLPRVYAWLLRNDKAWLKTHEPQWSKQARNTSSVNWNQRDLKLAVAVRSTALSLLNAPGKPILVSKSAIGKSLGLTTLLQQKINKLPMTAQTLKEVAESGEAFAARRVWWAAHRYLQEERFPRRWQLILRSNVYRWMEDPQVETALNTAMKVLEREDSYIAVAASG